ncbi:MULTISPECIES: NAD(P)/FAD-dependent oxidoreductase [Blastococcus]|uniref:FAD-dependent oxidoreductase n=2 Tax=Blastococcus TaxID=38501 RepID=A0A6L9W1N5_9ACTN|nr:MULTISPECIES: FAD-dependent oxidoreductase [Blastococcus]MCF6735935.1 FAD-dependent oxidoreductase [Blastococcus sp. KM273129]NEK86016.1 FAD-dependent oxidoreductase [Blastococcus saxobsidens]
MPEEPFVVVGASLAGLRAVESARKSGYTGRLILVGAEEHLPYDRPPLSKTFLDPGDEPAMPHHRTEDELRALDVELRLGVPATALDTAGREIILGDDEWLRYERLVIATGARARQLPGKQLDGMHTLRTVEDARSIRRALDAGCRTVVVGGGFIGSEVASAARKRDVDVTILEAAPLPLVRAVGEQMAAPCADLHARNGTELRCGVSVTGLEGEDRVEGVALSDGSVLPADLVVVGIGADPVTDWLTDSGLQVDDGVVCDETLRADTEVYAAGDVARWPNPLFGRTMRLEHWTSAAEQGAAAARNALAPAEATPYGTVPYFWSDWYTDKLQMVGITAADEVTVIGDLDGTRWLALYRHEDLLVGALALNMPGKIMKYRAMIGRRTAWQDALAFAGR